MFFQLLLYSKAHTNYIRLVGGELTLEVNGEIQNSASWCERIPSAIGLQSEGAVIEFKNIVLRTP